VIEKRMVGVTARKIRDQGRERASVAIGRTYTGYLISYPVVGRGMVIFRDPTGHRMVTTPVKRVLGDPDSGSIYVETENSVYRIEFHEHQPQTHRPTAQSHVG
jgi:hypothetical protein